MQNIKISSIERNILNPRKNFDSAKLKELADSIREVGIIEPLVVSAYQPNQDPNEEYRFRIIAGERRWRAATMAGLDEVPCIVKFNMSAEQEIRMAVIENLQRQDLDPIEEARAYKLLLDTNNDITQETLAKELGVSQSHIANRIRLLDLPEEIQENISREIISPSHGRVLAGCKNVPVEIIKKAAETIASDNVPVAKTADLVRKQVADNGMPLYDHWSTDKKPRFKCGKGSDCYECEHRAMGAAWASDQDQPYCMNRECWDKKQAEALQKNIEKAENADVVDIGKLSFNQYEYWHEGSSDYDQSECNDCAKRKLGKDRGSQYYCLDPACMKKKKTAMTKIKNKASHDAFQVEIEKIAKLSKDIADMCATFDVERPVLIYLAAHILAKISNDSDRKITRYQYLKDKFGWEDDLFKSGWYQLLFSEWDTFRSRLETLSEQQLWEIIFEWPAVAEGLKGIRSWMLEYEPPDDSPANPVVENDNEPENDTDDFGREGRIKGRVGWIICNSVSDPNYDSNISLLTDDELIYCLQYEKRKAGLTKLEVEARGRGIWMDYLLMDPMEIEVRLSKLDTNENLPTKGRKESETAVDVEPDTYIDDKGRLLFVSPGISGGETWMTCYTKPGGKGSHRLKSPSLPLRNTREEAQADLDIYARGKGYKLAAEAEPANENVQAILETDDLYEVWNTLVKELTDEELLDVIRRERRPSAKSKLRKEARRRELDTKGVA